MLRVIVALFASMFLGTLVVQLVAESRYGDETLIIAYMLVPLVSLVWIFILGLAGRGESGLDRLDRLGPAGVLLFFIFGFALAGLEFWSAGVPGVLKSAPVIIAMAGGAMVAVAVQWLILRRGRGAPGPEVAR